MGGGSASTESVGTAAVIRPELSVWVRNRHLFEPAVDALLWILALILTDLLRYGGAVGRDRWERLAVVAVLAIAAQLALGFGTSLYRISWRVGSFEEAAALARTIAGVTAILVGYVLAMRTHPVPVSVVLAAGTLTAILAGSVRSGWRINRERRMRPTERAERAIVFGAGEGGVQVINSLLGSPESPYVPVALLDDDPRKRSSRVRHLRVSGTREDLPGTAKHFQADTVIIAVPSADSSLIREVSELARDGGLTVKVLPPPHQFFSSPITVDDIRPISEADLLGRHVVDTEIDSVAGYLTGRRVLVTGAGGSIGSELCRQIHRFAPDTLVMLDRDESALHRVQLSIHGRALLDERTVVVCDIRDPAALEAVFDEHRPEVVFHAAALKHLPLLEMWPAEAVKTNVQGTQNVLQAAARVGAERFVNISTDKAANPCSVLGYTKRLAEGLASSYGHQESGTYLSVRFGNVLGSRGSVLTAFRYQLDTGGPITVTHPDVTRYFMMVEEAVQLVIQAGAVGRSGEVLVLDMGEPVKIDEVAKRMILEADRPIKIVYTGLRPGEKLHEDLFGDGEADERPVHPLISHVAVPPVRYEELHDLTLAVDDGPEHLVPGLRHHCQTTARAMHAATPSTEL